MKPSAALPTRIRIGTRGSKLALVQANMVKTRLEQVCPTLADNHIEIVPITTSGDKFQDRPLFDIGGKALFTKEIEEALLANTIDIAVHSIKDMENTLVPELMLACALEREDPRDVLVCAQASSIATLPANATFGTSSMRRAAQAKMIRPDLQIVPFRGNVQTRLQKLERGDVVATMLAQAGLSRLEINHPALHLLSIEEILPAVGQGAIGIECRTNDEPVRGTLNLLNHAPTMRAITAERAMLRALGGTCRTPIAGYARIIDDTLHLQALLLSPDGQSTLSSARKGSPDDAEKLGAYVGEELLKRGSHLLKMAESA